MKKQLRHVALLTCLAAAATFGSQLTFADSGAPDTGGAPQAAGPMHHPDHQGRQGKQAHRFFKRMAKELGLTDQQKVQVKALFKANHEANRPLRSSLMAERRQLRALEFSGTADEAAIRAQAAKVAALQADLAVKKAQSAKDFLGLLTPDQVTKLRAMQARMEKKMEHFRYDEGPAGK